MVENSLRTLSGEGNGEKIAVSSPTVVFWKRVLGQSSKPGLVVESKQILLPLLFFWHTFTNKNVCCHPVSSCHMGTTFLKVWEWGLAENYFSGGKENPLLFISETPPPLTVTSLSGSHWPCYSGGRAIRRDIFSRLSGSEWKLWKLQNPPPTPPLGPKNKNKIQRVEAEFRIRNFQKKLRRFRKTEDCFWKRPHSK